MGYLKERALYLKERLHCIRNGSLAPLDLGNILVLLSY